VKLLHPEENSIESRNTGPVDPRLIAGTASLLIAGVALLEYFDSADLGTLLRCLMFFVRLAD
jgi:hypothetical protein